MDFFWKTYTQEALFIWSLVHPLDGSMNFLSVCVRCPFLFPPMHLSSIFHPIISLFQPSIYTLFSFFVLSFINAICFGHLLHDECYYQWPNDVKDGVPSLKMLQVRLEKKLGVSLQPSVTDLITARLCEDRAACKSHWWLQEGEW